MRAIIVDDEENNILGLRKLLERYAPQINVIDVAYGMVEAKDKIESLNPELVFLDIELPDGDGFTLLSELSPVEFQVIFTTAFAEYAIKAIRFAALDYLLKPINVQELIDAINKATKSSSQKIEHQQRKLEVLESNRNDKAFRFQKIALPSFDGIEFYNLADILRCEADRAYCKFYFVKGPSVVVSQSLGEFEDILKECNFLRIHKSNMVNLNHIKKYVRGTGGYVILTDDSHVDVSIRKKEELLKALSLS